LPHLFDFAKVLAFCTSSLLTGAWLATIAFFTASRLPIKDFFCTDIQSSICGPFGPNLTFAAASFSLRPSVSYLDIATHVPNLIGLVIPPAPSSFSKDWRRTDASGARPPSKLVLYLD
jgi:hypothetical protein